MNQKETVCGAVDAEPRKVFVVVRTEEVENVKDDLLVGFFLLYELQINTRNS